MRQVVMAGIVLTVLAAPISGQSSSSAVTIAVPPVQVLRGTVRHSLLPGVPQSGHLTVQSNIPWVLRAEVDGDVPVAWRPSGASGWLPLGAGAPLRSGGRGTHVLAYEIRSAGRAGVRFVLEPLP